MCVTCLLSRRRRRRGGGLVGSGAIFVKLFEKRVDPQRVHYVLLLQESRLIPTSFGHRTAECALMMATTAIDEARVTVVPLLLWFADRALLLPPSLKMRSRAFLGDYIAQNEIIKHKWSDEVRDDGESASIDVI